MKKIGVFLLATLLLLCTAACEKDGADDPKTPDTENGTTAAVSVSPEGNEPEEGNVGEKDPEDVKEPEDEKDPSDGEKVFWFRQQNWEDQEGSFEGGLFHEELGLPLDFAQLDELVADRLENASFGLPKDGMEDLPQRISSESISELLNLEDKVKSKWNADINMDSEIKELTGMNRLRFQNYGNDSLPISTLYEDGWWWIECWDASCLLLEYEEDEGLYKQNLLSALAEKFGKPAWIAYYNSEDDFYEILSENSGYLEYSMIYTYPGYVLEVQMYEEIYSDDTPSKAYVRGVRYYSETGWEVYAQKTIGLYVFETRK